MFLELHRIHLPDFGCSSSVHVPYSGCGLDFHCFISELNTLTGYTCAVELCRSELTKRIGKL